MWNQKEAIELATKVEEVCVTFGCHVALTGGTLYKTGPRKDCDLLFYRIRQMKLHKKKLLKALANLGIVTSGFEDYGFVHKAQYNGKSVDLLFPETKRGRYTKAQSVHG